MRCPFLLCALTATLLAVTPVRARACPGDCDGSGAVTINELVALVDLGLSGLAPDACLAGDVDGDGQITIDELIAAVSSALLGCRSMPSATPTDAATPTATPTGSLAATSTATISATPVPDDTATATGTAASPSATASVNASRTATPSVNPTQTATRTATPSATSAATGTATRSLTATNTPTPSRTSAPSFTATATASPTPGLGTRRFSLDPQTSRLELLPDLGTFGGFGGFLDLAAGPPDPVTGLARVDVVGASEFLSVQVEDLRVCIKPIVPVIGAGVLACNGGHDLGVSSSQDHNIGVVGVDGFTAQECADAGGAVEAPSDPHPGVCNGPVDILPSPEADSGIGALLIAPDARFETEGLPAEVTIATGECDTHGPGDPTLFGFVSGVSRATIADANNVGDAIFQHDEDGENFSCAQWMQENGPGRLVLSVPAVHGSDFGDLITVFVLDD
jgi:hypothetical protein